MILWVYFMQDSLGIARNLIRDAYLEGDGRLIQIDK